MDRLPFVLPDFTRLLWVSDAARAVWEPRLARVTRAWLDIEWRAVVAGVRRCAITFADPQRLVSDAADWLDHGLVFLPLQVQGVGTTYASTPVIHVQGQPFVYRIVVGRTADVEAFRTAWREADDRSIGLLLGYPPCCTEFFRRTWVDDAMVDTTWPMAAATAGIEAGTRSVTVTGPPAANILWRWMGARAVPHLPCRTDCADSAALGERLLEVGRACGHGEEVSWLEEILSWPVEWSALHGIAEVKTPVLKVSTRTDATAVKYVVRREGTGYPAEGARGLTFPYRTIERPILTTSLAFRRGLKEALPATAQRAANYAMDNGFLTVAAMDEAHAPIVAFAASLLSALPANVIDLGCGNGALLGKLRSAHPTLVPYGVDHDADRIGRARQLLPDFADHFWVGDMFDDAGAWAADRQYDVALVMPGRFLEVDAARASAARQQLKDTCRQLIVYAYGDWLTRYGSLEQLAVSAGFSLDRTEGPVGLGRVA
jgi:hypothetical protein